MYIIIKTKDTDNIIGLKEDIAMRLEGVVGVERISILEDNTVWIHRGAKGYGAKSPSSSSTDIGDTLSYLIKEMTKREEGKIEVRRYESACSLSEYGSNFQRGGKMISDIKIIIREDKDYLPNYDENGELIPIHSTVGLRFKFKGEDYGQYITFNKLTLDAVDVVEAANALLESMEKVVEELGRTQDVRKNNNR